MSAAPSSGIRRHTASNPCRICGGWDGMKRHQGERCHGYLSTDGKYEHCSREDFAGSLPEEKGGTYAHRLAGECKCGETHGPALDVYKPPRPARGGKAGRPGPGPKPSARKARAAAVRTGPDDHTHAYEYRDAAGNLLYEVRRYAVPPEGPDEPPGKTFRQWSRDASGLWQMNRGGHPETLYHLPQLAAADRERAVWIVEGEKDVETLERLGEVATCNVGGAGKWRDEFGRILEGRTCYVIADNDETGREHARQVARNLAGLAEWVKVLDLVELARAGWQVPEKGDVSDLVALGATVEDLEFFADRTPLWEPGEADGVADEADAWDEPTLYEAGAAAPFPVHVFPAALAELVTTGARCFPCPVDLLALPALAVASAAIGKTVTVRVKRGWEETASLFLALVAETGMTKTPALKLITQPVWQIHHDLIQEYEADLAAYEALKAAYEAKKGKNAGPPPRKPFPSRFVLDNATVEAMAPILANNTRGLFQLKDELSGLFGGMGQYKAGKGDDQQFYLCLHSGVTVAVDRKALEGVPILVRDPFLTLFGGIQPKVLAGLDALDKEDGLCERFLFARPDWVKVRMTWDAAPDDLREDWCAAVRRIWDRKMVRGEDGRDRPFVVGMTEEAARLFEAFYNANEEEAESPDFPTQLKGAWPKFRAACARLALVLEQLHWAYDPTAGMAPWPVGSHAMAGAIELVAYFKAHLRRARGITRAPETKASADGRAILEWVRGAKLKEFTIRDARRNFPSRFAPDGPELGEALEWLKARHCIRPAPPKASARGRKPSPRYLVNPELPRESAVRIDRIQKGGVDESPKPGP